MVSTPLILAATLLLALPGHSATVLLYHDDFNFTGALDGRTPTVTTGGNTWTANASFQADATIAGGSVSPLATNVSAYLPFVPQTGFIYELTASMANASGGTGVLALGFSEGGNINQWFNQTSVNGYGTLGLRGNNNIQWWAGPRATGATTGNVAVSAGYHDVKLVLNTEQASWTMDLFVNDTQIDLNTGDPDSMTHVWASSSLPVINFVTLSGATDSSTARYADFSLLQIPEPTSIGMLLGGLGLLLLARKRTRRAPLH